MEKYNFKIIEEKWQKFWEENQVFSVSNDSQKPKYYCLIEFPYPSGDGLHVGHPRSYTALDILARKRRMQGYNVLYPIGFDAFGLPSENYAIKTGIPPAVTTKKNIETFTRQLKSLGFSFDWNRSVTTTEPEYYKWTQWIFLKLFEHGLAYKQRMPINWCTSCKIGLANEEVVNGACERCGGKVEKRNKEQWLLKITDYAERLIADLADVDYPDRIKSQQYNWIGKSDGAVIDFKIQNTEFKLEVFTTRPDTIFGATFMVVAPEHELISNLKSQISNFAEVENYVAKAKVKSEIERTDVSKEKIGVELKDIKAINPLSGEEIPVWVADYVLANYGSGAVMAVPAHDQRDYEFAKKYNLPIVEVISGGDITKEAHTDVDNGELVNSPNYNGLPPKKAIEKITQALADSDLGHQAINYKLRDWVFSRQRYWGEPIPLVFCENCAKNLKSQVSNLKNEYSLGEMQNPGWIPLPESELPLTLPEVERFEPTDIGDSPLAALKDWVNITCPKCGKVARRETDTMPNWAGSNWYFMRYADPKNEHAFASEQALKYWMPVDWYNGGMEHTTLHLLYSRFIYKFLYDIGAVPKSCGPEPYKKRTSHGLILGEGGEKMSKSKGNVVNPDDVVRQTGADSFRLYEMFMGPFDQAIPWDTNGLLGVKRFLEKVWSVFNGGIKIGDEEDAAVTSLLHETIKKVSQDIETQSYNTAVSAMMIFINGVNQSGKITNDTAEIFVKLLYPFAPHVSEELWEVLGHHETLTYEAWPEHDESLLAKKEIELVVQVNGKVRDKLTVSAEAEKIEIEALARKSEKIKKYLEGAAVKNVVFVPGRLINFVI